MKRITYKINNCTQHDILTHLIYADNYFIPSLSSRVTLEKFAHKITTYATTIEAYADGVLIGLLSAYFNDKTSYIGYINHLAISKEYQNQGISKILLHKCFEYGENNHFYAIRLEVSKENKIAQNLYYSLNFGIEENRNTTIIMKKILNKRSTIYES